VSRPDARPRGTRRFATRLALVVIIIAVAVYLVLLSDLNRVLRWRLDKLHAAGIPTTWAEVAPPPVPDKDNAAIIYRQAFKRLDVERRRRGGISDGECIRNFIADDPPGARDRLYPRIQQILARNKPALALLKQAGARPRCRFPLRWDQSPCAMEFRHLGPLRTCADLLIAEALVAARRGDAAQVTDACRAAIRMSGHIASEPTTISFLVAVGTESRALRCLPDLLPDANLDPGMCQTLFRELDRLDFAASCRRVTIAQGCETLWFFDEAKRRPGNVRGILTPNFSGDYAGGNPSSGSRVAVTLYLSPLGKLLRLREEIAYLDTFDATIALTAKPYRATAARWRAREQRASDVPFYYLITRATVPFGHMVARRDYAVAYRNAMQVALALKAYRAQHGAYPDSLVALRGYPGGASAAPEMRRSPIQGWKLPQDPFSGKDFCYHRQGAGFILYSWGEDLKDDGGRPVSERYRTYPPDGDIVWTFEKQKK
jgi:hypothetical protein